MKKFVNDVEQMLTESLQGLAAAHSDLLTLHLDPTFVTRKQPLQRKVALISGGGSGHEPLHCGFIGTGMLDVLIPASRLLLRLTDEDSDQGTLCARLKQEAESNMLATRDMIATKGRAHFLGERALGHIDPGAKTSQVALFAVCDMVSANLRDAPLTLSSTDQEAAP